MAQATSLSDLATKIAAQVGASGAVFRVQNNADGSLTVFRAPSATSGVWSVLYPRLIFNAVSDQVQLGDGSDIAVTGSSQFVASLN